MKKILALITISVLILSNYALALAFDVASQESSTSSTDYDYFANYQVEQDKAMKSFKAKVAESVFELKKGIANLESALETNQLKYSRKENSATLGDLYGGTGALEVNKAAYSGKLDFSNGVIAASDSRKIQAMVAREPNFGAFRNAYSLGKGSYYSNPNPKPNYPDDDLLIINPRPHWPPPPPPPSTPDNNDDEPIVDKGGKKDVIPAKQ